MANLVITIGRENGSGGRQLGSELAEALGVSRQAVSKWESGASDPSTANLIALAKLFGTTPEELLKESQ